MVNLCTFAVLMGMSKQLKKEEDAHGTKEKPQLIPKVTFTGITEDSRSVSTAERRTGHFADNTAPDVVDVLLVRKEGVPMGFLQHFIIIPKTGWSLLPALRCMWWLPWQHLSYEAQARHKQKVVEDALQRIGKVQVEAFSHHTSGAFSITATN